MYNIVFAAKKSKDLFFQVTVVFRRVPQQTKTWMATPPKQPPGKQSNCGEPLNTTPSESSEADTTEDDTADDDDEWDSGESASMHCVKNTHARKRTTVGGTGNDDCSCGDNNSLIDRCDYNESIQ